MSENSPEEPQPQADPAPEPAPDSPAFELLPSTFEVTEKADKNGREYRDLRPDN